MPPDIFIKSLENLTISDVLRSFMEQNDFDNLDQVIKTGIPKLQRMPEFTVHCMEELLLILDKHNSLHLLSEE